MNIVIRTDSSIEIGTGHVMRCLTLAKQLKRLGASVTFVCRDLQGNSIKYLQSEKFEVFAISSLKSNSRFVNSIEENWLNDVEETIMVTKNIDIDLVVVDHYSLDIRWEEKMRNIVNKIMVIDDLANREHDCDFLLDQNYYPNMNSRYIDLVPEDCVLMLGPNYVLLRDEFIEAAIMPRERTGKKENLLMFFGGTDPTGETLKTLKSISEMDSLFKNIDVVVGNANKDKHQIKMLCNKMNNTHFHCQISNMAELMMKADLSIGAGGSTTWERCLLGLPSIVIITAENQRELTEVLNSKKVIMKCSSNCFEIYQKVSMLINNHNLIMELSKQSSEIISIHKVKSYPVAKKIAEEIL